MKAVMVAVRHPHQVVPGDRVLGSFTTFGGVVLERDTMLTHDVMRLRDAEDEEHVVSLSPTTPVLVVLRSLTYRRHSRRTPVCAVHQACVAVRRMSRVRVGETILTSDPGTGALMARAVTGVEHDDTRGARQYTIHAGGERLVGRGGDEVIMLIDAHPSVFGARRQFPVTF